MTAICKPSATAEMAFLSRSTVALGVIPAEYMPGNSSGLQSVALPHSCVLLPGADAGELGWELAHLSQPLWWLENTAQLSQHRCFYAAVNAEEFAKLLS